jgi:hypothetical protein
MARQRAGISRWMVLAVMAAAFALGFAGHAITDPHRVDLLSASLIGIVLWNLLVYVLLLLSWLRSLVRRRKTVIAPLEPEPGQGAAPQRPVAAPGGWLQKLQTKRWSVSRGTGLRKMALNFERNWWQVNQRPRHAQWLVCLHLGAAMLALGALASLWLTGLTKAYQVGWESTFLSPSAVQTCLNLLFAPVQHLLGLAPWSLAQIQALQGWSAGDAADAGPRWVQLYSWLLGLMVVAPRLLLALWQGARVWWLSQHLALPLQQPYFQKLQRDWAGAQRRCWCSPTAWTSRPSAKPPCAAMWRRATALVRSLRCCRCWPMDRPCRTLRLLTHSRCCCSIWLPRPRRKFMACCWRRY